MNYPEGVTAGLGGFLILFFLGLATYLLMRNMNARLRRMRWRAEQEEAEEAEEAAHREAEQRDRSDGGGRSDGRHDRPVDGQ